MAIIQTHKYELEVDIEKTEEYYHNHTLCECGWCQNFYAQIQGKFPKLESFLSEFGVDISKPDEISSIELENTVQYLSVDYTVCGKVLAMGQEEIVIQDERDISLVITDGFMSPNEQTEDYFTISVIRLLEFPWVLDQSFPAPVQFKPTDRQTKGFLEKVLEFFRRK